MARVVTVGGSVGGLAAALVLSGRGHDVTVLERDPDPLPAGPDDAWQRWGRRGVPHLRGTHMFNARGLGVLRDHAPDALAALKEAGAREVPLPGVEFTRLSCRRTTYELALRAAALRRPSIRLETGAAAVDLVAAPRGRVVGVRTTDGRTFPADLVVDTGGRTSRVPSWLGALGVAVPRPDSRNSGMSVHTRWYRTLDPSADPEVVQLDLGYGAFVLAPADDGWFSVTFGTFGRDPGLRGIRHPDRHHAAAAAVPAIARWITPEVATPEGGVRSLGNLPNRRRPLAPASGVVWLGDAAVCTNPRFGRGVALALVSAVSLADALDGSDDPAHVGAAFAAATEADVVPWFCDAAAGDAVRRGIAERVRAGAPLDTHDPAVRLARATPVAVERDPVVRVAFLRTWHLLEPPEAFAGDPGVRARVEAVWRDVERDPPPPAGPRYGEMVAILDPK